MSKFKALDVRIEKGAIVIRAHAQCVAFATENHPEFWDPDTGNNTLHVEDEALWLKGVRSELKPCPFCEAQPEVIGQSARVEHNPTCYLTRFCGSRGLWLSADAEAWNRRPSGEPTEETKEIVEGLQAYARALGTGEMRALMLRAIAALSTIEAAGGEKP